MKNMQKCPAFWQGIFLFKKGLTEFVSCRSAESLAEFAPADANSARLFNGLQKLPAFKSVDIGKQAETQ